MEFSSKLFKTPVKDFWNFVGNMMPDYKKRKDILNGREI